MWKALSQSGLGSTSLCCSKKAVTDGIITEEEFAQIMREFKRSLPVEVCDPSSLGRIRFWCARPHTAHTAQPSIPTERSPRPPHGVT